MDTTIQQKARDLIASDKLDDAIYLLRNEGKGIIETIKIVRDIKKISLRDAKEIVALHPAWKDQHSNFEKFHDTLIEIFNDELE